MGEIFASAFGSGNDVGILCENGTVRGTVINFFLRLHQPKFLVMDIYHERHGVVLMVYKTNESIIVIQAEAINPNRTDIVFWSHDRGTAKLRMKLVRKNGIPQSLPEGTTVPIRLMFRSATAEGGMANMTI